MEKRAQIEQRKQQATLKAIANRATEQAEMEKTLRTAMLQPIGNIVKSDALAARATEEEAHAASQPTFAIARAGKFPASMQTYGDYTPRTK